MISFASLGRGLLKYGKATGRRVVSTKGPAGMTAFRDVRFAQKAIPQVGRYLWRNRKPVLGAAVIGYTGWKAGQGLIRGYNMNVMSPESMRNRAAGYGPFGDEENFRNMGRMPSNHLNSAGLTLSLSRLRHR